MSAFAARKAQNTAQGTSSPQNETPSSQTRSQKLVQKVKSGVPSRSAYRGKSTQVDLASTGPDFIAERSGRGEGLADHISRYVPSFF